MSELRRKFIRHPTHIAIEVGYINKLVHEYDQIVICGPVFPHEVVGFSGGNKYLFPGVAEGEIINFFHWLGALITNPKVIGNKYTPIRKARINVGFSNLFSNFIK